MNKKQVPRVKNFKSGKNYEQIQNEVKEVGDNNSDSNTGGKNQNGGSHRSNDDDNDAFDRRGSGTTMTQASNCNVQEITQIWHKTIQNPPKM